MDQNNKKPLKLYVEKFKNILHIWTLNKISIVFTPNFEYCDEWVYQRHKWVGNTMWLKCYTRHAMNI